GGQRGQGRRINPKPSQSLPLSLVPFAPRFAVAQSPLSTVTQERVKQHHRGGKCRPCECVRRVVIAAEHGPQGRADRHTEKNETFPWDEANEGQGGGECGCHMGAWKRIHTDAGAAKDPEIQGTNLTAT